MKVTATATRLGDWWAIEVTDVQGGCTPKPDDLIRLPPPSQTRWRWSPTSPQTPSR